jgi:hypothetical protein
MTAAEEIVTRIMLDLITRRGFGDKWAEFSDDQQRMILQEWRRIARETLTNRAGSVYAAVTEAANA